MVPLPTGKENAEVELVDFAKNPELLSTLICLSSAALAIDPPVPIVKLLAPVVISLATSKFNSPFTVALPLIVKPLVLLFLRLKKVSTGMAWELPPSKLTVPAAASKFPKVLALVLLQIKSP